MDQFLLMAPVWPFAELVAPPSENIIQDTNTSTSRSSTISPGSLQQASSSARQTPTCSMYLISQQLQAGGLLTQVAELICASLTKGTENQYKPVWKTWNSWCDQRHINPLQGNAVHLVHFLVEQFLKGKSYSSLKSHSYPIMRIVSKENFKIRGEVLTLKCKLL